MKEYEQRSSTLGKMLNFFSGNNFSKRNLYGIFKKIILSLGFLFAIIPGAQAAFDCNGNVSIKLGDHLFVTKDDISLSENGKKIDSIDWRIKGAPSPLDGTVSRKGVNGILSAKAGVVEIPDGVRITWSCSVPNAGSEKTLGVTASIPAEALSFLPQGKPCVVVKFGADKKGVIEGERYRYHFDLSKSNVDFTFAGVEDFRSADWWKKFRLTLNTAKLTKPNAEIVVEVTRTLNEKFFQKNEQSPFLAIPVAPNGNRTLDDQVENDGKGGWTDQGTNDLSVLKPGTLIAQGIPFEIGNKAIILRGKLRQSFPEKSPEMPVETTVERLAFCHTVAWNNNNKEGFCYRVFYDDGTTADIPVIGGLDVADWTGAIPTTARVKTAWKGSNNEHPVSLAHMQWKNPKPNVPVRAIQVLSKNLDPVGIVLAITAVKQDKSSPELTRFLNEQYFAPDRGTAVLPKEKKDWYECRIPVNRKIKHGSALDASFVNHAPAGKFGFVKRVGDHFEFAKRPGERAVFWGTCLSGAPEKQYAPLYAEALARAGVNIVRMHLWMNNFVHPGFPDEVARSFIRPGEKINEQTLDDYHFFFAELFKRGIYLYMDNIGWTRWLSTPGDCKFQAEVNEKLKNMTRKMYLSVNPYTGKRLVDDPGFAMCEIMNENSCTYGGDFKNLSPAVQEILSERWEKWQKERGISPLQSLHGTPMEGNGQEGRRFFAAQQRAFLEDWYGFLRGIGVNVPICGTNLELTAGDLWASQNMDFMNDHTYFGSSSAGGGFWQPKDISCVKMPLTAVDLFGEIIHSRLADKPIVCTEWSFVYPNVYRMEGYPFTAAFTAYQGIDAMLSFDWAGAYLPNLKNVVNNHRIFCLSQMADPSTWGLSQAAAIARLRGDIKPARKSVILKYTEDDIWSNRRQLPLPVSFLFQMGKVAIELPKPGAKNEWPLNTGKRPAELYADAAKRLGIDAGKDYVVSDTGELIRFSDPAMMLVDTPKSQFATGALFSLGTAPRRNLSAFKITSSMPFATLTFTSLDNLPLTQSKRILCCAVGNSANAKAVIDNKGYQEPSQGPVLSEPFYGMISARQVPGNMLKVYKLSPDTGERTGELKTTVANGIESFSIDQDTKTMYLELVRQ